MLKNVNIYLRVKRQIIRKRPAAVNEKPLSYSADPVKYHHLQLLLQLETQAPKAACMVLGYLEQLPRVPHD